jgi:hypothetical protein
VAARSRYSAELREGIIFVVDECGPGDMSVTNDAERVVAEVVASLGDFPILYLDTSEDLDWLVHDGSRFVRFATGNLPYPGV